MMKLSFKSVIVIIVCIAGLAFILSSLKKSSAPPQVAPPPNLADAPMRLYGMVEPEGREVLVGPTMSKRVIEVFVKEGEAVKAGQRLCTLESNVEQEQVNLAESRMALAQKSLELSNDDLNRTRSLYSKQVDSEYKFTQAQLQNAMELKRLKVAGSELDVTKAKFEETVLRSPIDGVVYKFDVRIGETLQAGDNSKIILGAEKLWVRLAVESFWKDRVKADTVFKVYDSETREHLGTGAVVRRVPYMGRRNYRTEDLQERFDTKFQDVILALKAVKKDIPIGLSVIAELQ
jgi:multidrug efflux pump subunit AcrA (membrane-fusion protein)